MDELLDIVLETLTRRTEQLNALEEALLDGRAAILRSALEEMLQAQRRQEAICQEIARLDSELLPAYNALESAAGSRAQLQQHVERMGPGMVSRSERIALAHDRAQRRVHDVAGVQRALLRRSLRTLKALQSVVKSHYPSYEGVPADVAGGYGPLQGRS